MTAAGTSGTTPIGVGRPKPRSSSHRTTPSAAASPNALPPVSNTAVGPSAFASDERVSISRVPVPPPRMSTPPRDPGGGITTVHPVRPSGSVQCPIRKPAGNGSASVMGVTSCTAAGGLKE